jgi:hypothetical protein
MATHPHGLVKGKPMPTLHPSTVTTAEAGLITRARELYGPPVIAPAIEASLADPFVPSVAQALVNAGFPADRIGWLTGDQRLQVELVAAMGCERIRQAARR